MNTFNRTDLSDSALRAWQEAHPELAPDRGKPMPEMRVNHDYDTPAQKAEQFREEIRATLAQLHDMITTSINNVEEMRAELEGIRAGLTQAASQPAPATDATDTFLADTVTFAIDENGKQAYKLRGGKFSKNGVRVWPEILPALGIDKDLLVSGRNPINPPIMVRVEIAKRAGKSDLGEDVNLQYDYARKVTGRA